MLSIACKFLYSSVYSFINPPFSESKATKNICYLFECRVKTCGGIKAFKILGPSPPLPPRKLLPNKFFYCMNQQLQQSVLAERKTRSHLTDGHSACCVTPVIVTRWCSSDGQTRPENMLHDLCISGIGNHWEQQSNSPRLIELSGELPFKSIS